MYYKRMGQSGLQLSALSFGAWASFATRTPRSEARNLIALSWDSGINFFDNAETYANGEAERMMGDVIADLRLPRDGYVVSSKVYFGRVENPLPTQRGLSRKHIHDACHAALKRLRVDYLDLFYCHRPDMETPVEETVLAMNHLIQQGKILYWGTSEWPAERIEQAHRIAREYHLLPPQVEQPEYNLLRRERVEKEYRALCEKSGMGLTTWSPLASGVLTGKYLNGVPENSRLGDPKYQWLQEGLLHDSHKTEVTKRLVEYANQVGSTAASLAIAWCMKNPNVTSVILGASTTDQLAQNLKALEIIENWGEQCWIEFERAIKI